MSNLSVNVDCGGGTGSPIEGLSLDLCCVWCVVSFRFMRSPRKSSAKDVPTIAVSPHGFSLTLISTGGGSTYFNRFVRFLGEMQLRQSRGSSSTVTKWLKAAPNCIDIALMRHGFGEYGLKR